MRWFSLFKVYNLKTVKKEKVLILLTAISILVASTISLMIPGISIENEKYINKNIEKVNGGDLSIVVDDEISNSFNNELEKLKKSGDEVNIATIINCHYNKSTNKVMGSIVIGNYSLEKDEIILQSDLADRLNVKVGDYIELDTNGNGVFKYKVKSIESLSSGVDRDAELLGYGKVQSCKELEKVTGRKFITVKGVDGDKIKNQLQKSYNSNTYTSITDKKREIKNEMAIEKSILGILTTVGYIFSTLTIITAIIMIIIRRKRDIAILKAISIDDKDIKRAFNIEMMMIIFIPIMISVIIAYFGIEVILPIEVISKETIITMAKSIIFNTIFFVLLINIALLVLKGISGISILREDKEALRKQSRKVIIITIVLLPTLLIGYSFLTGNIENIFSSLIVIIFIIVFLAIISLIIKVLSKVKFRKVVLIYTIKEIKGKFTSFIIVLISLTFTLSFILVGFSLESTIKKNFKDGLEDILPYNYYISSNDSESLEKVLKSNNDVEGYIKASVIEGKIVNSSIVVSEIDKDDYNIKYKIIEGKNLYEGQAGFIISDKMKKRNHLSVGDILEIETKNGVIKGTIKGIYKCGGINSTSIIKENVEFGEEERYYVKAKNGEFIDDIKNSYVASIGDLGDRLASNIDSFLRIFKILSIISIMGTVIFSINMILINSYNSEKEEEILLALGLGKIFILKVNIIKIVFLSFLSSLLSLGIYSGLIKLFFKVMIDSPGKISFNLIIITILISLSITIVAFIVPMRRIYKKRSLDLITQDN